MADDLKPAAEGQSERELAASRTLKARQAVAEALDKFWDAAVELGKSNTAREVRLAGAAAIADYRDAIKLILASQKHFPWSEITDSHVESWVEEVRKMKAERSKGSE